MLERLSNIEFVFTLIITLVCVVAWGQAGFPRFTEVVASLGFCLAFVGGILWLARYRA
jgi:hypothetical protein